MREGHAPPLHAVRERPAKWDCRGRPGERRAGCPHPAAPCGGAGFRGRDKSRPYGQILCFRQTGRLRCLPRFAGEGHGPPAGVRGRAGRADMESAPTWGVCGGGNVPGFEFQRCDGVNARPTDRGNTAANREMQPPWYTVGADSISARFATARGSAGGINPAPTGKFFVSGKSGGHDVCPGLQGRAMALPRGYAAGQAGPIWNRPLHGVFAAARGLREGHAPPLHAVRERPAKRDCRGHPGERRAGCPHPAGPRGGGNVPGFEFQRCGGRERPPYGPGETRRPPGKIQSPRCTVGADSISARFAAARSSAGGINPAPTNKFYALGHQNAPDSTPP